MTRNFSSQKGFISILALAGIILGVTILAGGVYVGTKKYSSIQREQAKKDDLLATQQKNLEDYATKLQELSNKPTSQGTGQTQSKVVGKTEQKSVALILTPTQQSPSNPICEKTKTEFTNFATEYNYTKSLSDEITQTFNKLPAQIDTGTFISDAQLAYQRNLAQKDSFTNILNAFDTELQKLPVLSFDQIHFLDLKQMSSNGSNGYRDAFNLKLAALKMVVDDPNSISTLDNAMAANKDYIIKAAYAKNYFAIAANDFTLMTQSYNKTLADNNCK